jgi:hypothetical protein
MAKNIYCLEKDTSGRWRKVRVSGKKKPVFSTVETLEDISSIDKATAYISIKTSQYTIAREFFPKLSADILEIQIKDKLKQLAFWGDVADMKISWKKISESDKRVELAVIACPFREINDIIDLLTDKSVKIHRITHFAVSVANIVGMATDDPVLAVIFDQGVLQILGIQNKIPFYHQLVPMEMDLVFDQANIKQSVELAKNSLNRIYGTKISGIMLFGENYNILEEVLVEQEKIDVKWENILICNNIDELKKYPALFGVYFTDKSHNMLTQSVIISYFIDDLINLSGYISIAACIFLMLFIYKLYTENKFLKSEFNRISSKIKTNVSELSTKYPVQEEKENIEKFVGVFEKYKEQQRLDNLIIQIAQSLPPDVIVKSLSMNFPMLNEQSQPITVSSGKWSDELQANLGHPYSLDITLATKGSYANSLRELNKTKGNLTEIFFLENAVINYEEKKSEGTLKCLLKSKKPPEKIQQIEPSPLKNINMTRPQR